MAGVQAAPLGPGLPFFTISILLFFLIHHLYLLSLFIILYQACKRLPWGLGSLVALFTGPGNEQTRAIEEEVAKLLEEQARSGKVGGGTAVGGDVSPCVMCVDGHCVCLIAWVRACRTV